MAKTITIKDLSVSEIKKAKTQVESYKKELNQKVEELLQIITDRGIEIAKAEVVSMGAFDSGVLESSITGYYSPSLGVGIVYTNCYYAIYVEFGTGVVGASNSHPKSGELGYKYDANGHGSDGWFYYNDSTGKSGWTTGMPSRPFMYETSVQLKLIAEELAKQYLRSS